MTKRLTVRVRRIYDQPTRKDGTRVLVDRVWPRGLSKDEARLDEWFKQVAPSTKLRKWYAHDPDRFTEFTRRYLAELEDISIFSRVSGVPIVRSGSSRGCALGSWI